MNLGGGRGWAEKPDLEGKPKFKDPGQIKVWIQGNT